MFRRFVLPYLLGMGTVLAGSLLVASREAGSSYMPTTAQQLPMTAILEVQSQTIGLEVARTDEQLATGLMFRDDLPADVGMLFELSRPKPQILWTKGLNFPIDIVFLRDGKVLLVIPNVPPCPGEPCPVYGSSEPVDQVLELRGGRAAELGLVPGKRVTIQPVAGRS